MSNLLPPNSWAERKRNELALRLSRQTMHNLDGGYVYAGCCIDFDGELVTKMIDSEVPDWPPRGEKAIEEMRRFCVGIDLWAEVMGYVTDPEDGLIIENDWHLSYGKGFFDGVPCYWIDHSRIEYIWVDATAGLLKFNLGGVTTGRMSCRKPNISNTPRTDLTPEQKVEYREKAKQLVRDLGYDPDIKLPPTDYAELERRAATLVAEPDFLTPAEKAKYRAAAKSPSFTRRQQLPARTVQGTGANFLIQMEAAEKAARACGVPMGDTEVIVDGTQSLKEAAKAILGFGDDPDAVAVVPLAISIPSVQKWGCPYCGYYHGQIPLTAEGTLLWVCSDCGKTCHVLLIGLKASAIGHGGGELNGVKIEPVYPQLRKHPREGQAPRKEKSSG